MKARRQRQPGINPAALNSECTSRTSNREYYRRTPLRLEAISQMRGERRTARIYGESMAGFRNVNRYLPALKAPAYASPGQRPGFRHRPFVWHPEGAQDSSAPSGRIGSVAILVHGFRFAPPVATGRRPFGTCHQPVTNPALKRRAILGCRFATSQYARPVAELPLGPNPRQFAPRAYPNYGGRNLHSRPSSVTCTRAVMGLSFSRSRKPDWSRKRMATASVVPSG